MKVSVNLILILYALLAVLMVAPAYAEPNGSPIPFGGYRKNGRCGCYGAKVAITTEKEARKVVEEFLVGSDLHIGNMIEHPRFFKAELLDGNGVLRDIVIVDRRNGRIRSIY